MEELLRTLKSYCANKNDHALNALVDKLIATNKKSMSVTKVIDSYLENPQNTFEVNETLLSIKSKFTA